MLSLPIVNEEDGKTYTVSKWGVRVPEATYEAIRDDKSDDGIVAGEHPRREAARHAEGHVSHAGRIGGAITEW